MAVRSVTPRAQADRPPCSLPMRDTDFALGNANWTKALEVASQFIWTGNLNPVGFPNNLARFFLHIPGIFEQQLYFSTSLLFDEPSFKNGVQISGFLDRVCRELAISLTAQRRRCWYSMTHHAFIGWLQAQKYGLSAQEYIAKWGSLVEWEEHPEAYTRVERAALAFADAFSRDPRSYTDEQYKELRDALEEDDERRYPEQGLWMARLRAAREARAAGLREGLAPDSPELDGTSRAADDGVDTEMPREAMERHIDAQVVELAFVCLQFVALTCVFTGLNIPDEEAVSGAIAALLPPPVIQRLNQLNDHGVELSKPDHGAEPLDLVPGPLCDDPDVLSPDGKLFNAIRDGEVVVAPAFLEGARVALTPYEGRDKQGDLRPAFAVGTDRDRGVVVAGAQTGVYGWGFGGHFPGGLVYLLMDHPELSRHEPPYSLPLLFNEDEWRNGTQTAGYVTRRLKELVIQKIYRTVRSRYGLEHHTMYYYNTFADEYGGATDASRERAEKATLYIHDHHNAPDDTFTPLEMAVMDWVESLLRRPHLAHTLEPDVRKELEAENDREIKAGLRRLDASDNIGEQAAMARLLDHQIAELAMVIGHMDGLARVLTILRVEAEPAVTVLEGQQEAGGFKPKLKNGYVQFTGYFNNRPALHDVLRFIGISDRVLTLNELVLNPELCKALAARVKKGETGITITADEAEETAEF